MKRSSRVVRTKRPHWLLRVMGWLAKHTAKLSWRGSVVCVKGWRWSIPLFALILLFSPRQLPPPKNPDNLCEIFQERPEWVAPAKASVKEWGTPIYVMMAIMYQESAFIANARPPFYKWLGVVPLYRMSSAYGYSQALDATWKRYQQSRKRWLASRTRFDDAIDFIGWYNTLSRKHNGILSTDARSLYLAYHEGHGGFSRRSWKKKRWLQNVASRVERRAQRYKTQLAQCPSFK